MMEEYGHLHIGVLAIQGDYERHLHQLRQAGARSRPVRLVADLSGLDGLILPGGESTTISKMIDRFDLREPLLQFADKKPVFGTCAGMIMLARSVADNQASVRPLGLIDIEIARTAYGRQIHSFEAQVEARLNGTVSTLEATFIRAPMITRAGPAVKILATHNDLPVLVSERRALAASFHTELGEDLLLLRYFLRTFC
ncbi:MAG: pyridoxal 5'-phosphate synthase glutaminase subunit PdxT [Candidatus Zixiibacteriota bacterium]